ncbi:glycosyltransferase [Streptomyces sp. NPDC054940]
MNLTVTVLVPAHNEADTITRCIAAVRASTYPVQQIVVVADACTDNTAQLARQAGADVVLETRFEDKAAAQNAALWDITTDLVVGFDGDTWPDPDCIRLMVEHIERDSLDATCSTILPAQGAVVPYTKTGLLGRAQAAFFTRSRRFAYALGRRWWRLCQAKVGRIQVRTGACYTFRTEAIQAIGGFPNGLITADMDATWALHGSGYKLDYTGAALAWTLDPEDFSTYRNQMRRWSSGYYQNMAKHRGQLRNWRSMLVVGGAIFDLVSLFAVEAMLVHAADTGTNESLLRAFVFWTAVHTVVSIGFVASVVGLKEAVLGVVPYTLVNYYNKWLYLCAFVREWILGRHYASWTGRQGRKTVITPMTMRRRWTLGQISVVAGTLAMIGGGYLGNTSLFGLGAALAAIVPLTVVPWRGTGKRRAPRTTAPVNSPVAEQIPVAKLLDPYADAETTLTLPIPRQRTAAPQPERTA